MALSKRNFAPLAANALQFLPQRLVEKFQGHLAPIHHDAAWMMYPLPQLRPRDLGSRRILHEMVKRHTTQPSQPRFQVLNTDANIGSQSLFGNGSFGRLQQLGSADLDIIPSPVNLVG